MLEGVRVLIADDDEMSLDMLSMVLESKGVHCTCVADGKKAMDVLESSPDIDIVLLDLLMPVMDGFEVLAQCKWNPYLCDIPIIVLAADHYEKLTSLKLGADDFLEKPYNYMELELRMAKLVRAFRLVRSAKRAKYEFLTVASHELRTPMHQVTGLAELLGDKCCGSDERELADLLKQATGRLSDTITHILDYTRLDHSTASAVAEPFSLRSTVLGALEAKEDEADKKGIRLVIDMADSVSDELNGPFLYVHKVFSFLIENAVKFSSAGEVRISIWEESFGRYGSRFSCSVSDQGIGIPPEFHEKIFEPFAQVDSSPARKYEGLGLGLAITRRMVELMGGTISVSSVKNGGSSFDFSFHCQLQGAQEGR